MKVFLRVNRESAPRQSARWPGLGRREQAVSTEVP